jgi:hypothetical protein
MVEGEDLHVAAALTDNEEVLFFKVNSSCDFKVEREKLRPLMERAISGQLDNDIVWFKYQYASDGVERGMLIDGEEYQVFLVVSSLDRALRQVVEPLVTTYLRVIELGIAAHERGETEMRLQAVKV